MKPKISSRNRPANTVEISCDLGEPPSWIAKLTDFVRWALVELEVTGREVAIRLVDDGTIRDLNRRFRDIDEPTDVLSFPATGSEHLGDIAIDLEQVERQATELSVPFEQELRRMTVHGVLHLCGKDHRTNDFTTEPMLILQEELLSRYKERLF